MTSQIGRALSLRMLASSRGRWLHHDSSLTPLTLQRQASAMEAILYRWDRRRIPKTAGDLEVRYAIGQGDHVLVKTRQ
jgi:hypothetical protein